MTSGRVVPPIRGIFSLLIVLVLASLCTAQVKSGSARIILRATLEQSLTMSALPEGLTFNAFANSSATVKPDFPVSIRTNWVRGPGRVSLSVFSEDGSLKTAAPSSELPELRFESKDLQLPARREGEVLTVRAQVI